MITAEKKLRILIVDDNRDGADALGLLLEELGNHVHVTYGGARALDVAKAFRPDLILVDLLMPEMDGFTLVAEFRKRSGFSDTKIVAITGQKGDESKTQAIKAGCDLVLFKPVTLEAVHMILTNLQLATAEPSSSSALHTAVPAIKDGRLPIGDARRLRSGRPSKSLTQSEIEASLCDGIIRFQDEYLGWRADHVCTHLIKDMLLVRITGVLTLAEQQLSKSAKPEQGRDLIKQTRKQLLELARPMLESLIYEVAGVKVSSMHHDISTQTGEEIVIFSLADTPKSMQD